MDENTDIILLNKVRAISGDSTAALILGMCYASGSKGAEKNPELGLKYLKDAADLCHPEALHILTNLYQNNIKYGCIVLEPDIVELVKYLRLLCGSIDAVDYSSFNEGKTVQKYLKYWWEGYSTLGRLYVTIPGLDEVELGLAMSMRGAEEANLPQSYYAVGMYYKSIQDYSRSSSFFGKAAFGYNDNSYWAKESERLYGIVSRMR